MPLPVLHGGPGLGHNYLLPQRAQLADQLQLIFGDQRGTGMSGGRVDSASITMDNYSLRNRGRHVRSAGISALPRSSFVEKWIRSFVYATDDRHSMRFADEPTVLARATPVSPTASHAHIFNRSAG